MNSATSTKLKTPKQFLSAAAIYSKQNHQEIHKQMPSTYSNHLQLIRNNINTEINTEINKSPITQKEVKHRDSMSLDFFDCDEDEEQTQTQIVAVDNLQQKGIIEKESVQEKFIEEVIELNTEIPETFSINIINNASSIKETLQQEEEESPQIRPKGSRRRNAIMSLEFQREQAEEQEEQMDLIKADKQRPQTKATENFKCKVPGCVVTFKSAQALKGHMNVCGKNDEIECPNKFCCNRFTTPGKKYKGIKGLNIHRKKCDPMQPKP